MSAPNQFPGLPPIEPLTPQYMVEFAQLDAATNAREAGQLRADITEMRARHEVRLDDFGITAKVARQLTRERNKEAELDEALSLILAGEAPVREPAEHEDQPDVSLPALQLASERQELASGKIKERILIKFVEPDQPEADTPARKPVLLGTVIDGDTYRPAAGFDTSDVIVASEMTAELNVLVDAVLEKIQLEPTEPIHQTPRAVQLDPEQAAVVPIDEQRHYLTYMHELQAKQLEESGTANRARHIMRQEAAKEYRSRAGRALSGSEAAELGTKLGDTLSVAILPQTFTCNKLPYSMPTPGVLITRTVPGSYDIDTKRYFAPLYTVNEAGEQSLREGFTTEDEATILSIVDVMIDSKNAGELLPNLSNDLTRINRFAIPPLSPGIVQPPDQPEA